MRMNSLITFGLAAYTSFKAYENRDKIKSSFKESVEAKNAIQSDLDRIKANLAVIKSETANIQAINQELTYKLRRFNKETEPIILQIKERMEKYQTPSEDK
ncbi:chemotaxis protein [Streptococcus hongkongensis]|nr:chemotaxis protein [Streptococcus uberis]